MTPDDAQIPEDDAIARAARDALGALAGRGSTERSWSSVQAGARRVRTRRLVAVGVACAIVLVGAGAAAAVGRGGNAARRTAPIAGSGENSTTTESTSTSEPATTRSTESTPLSPPGTVDSTTTTVPLPVAQPTDLTGTITLASTVLMVGQPATVTLTLRNVSDHPVSLPRDALLNVGVSMPFDVCAGFDFASDPGLATLAAGEERSFTTTLTPVSRLIGSAQISAGFLTGVPMFFDCGPQPVLDGVPPVTVSVVPPGWTPAQSLDPAQGKWSVEMSADATEVAVGDSVVVHAKITNVGDQMQEAVAYGALAIGCDLERNGYGAPGQRVGLATLAPGDTVSFSYEFHPQEYQVGAAACSVGMMFPNSSGPEHHDGLVSDTVAITVLPPGSTTSTSTATTSTTSP